jgi:signal transduction histidine kinase
MNNPVNSVNEKFKIIGKCQITGLLLKTKDSWKYQTKDYLIHPYIIGDGSIIVINSEGRPSIEGIKFGISLFNEIQNYFKKIKKFVIISNQKKIKSLPSGARRIYIDYVKNNDKLSAVIFYNVNSIIKLSLKLGKSLNHTNVEVLSMNSYDESIKAAYNILNNDFKNINKNSLTERYLYKFNNTKKKYTYHLERIINYRTPYINKELNFLNEFLLNIDWKNDSQEFDITKFNHSPFNLIYKTIIYIKSDLHNLINERDLQRKELEYLNEALENKVEKRTKELKNINDNLLKEIANRKRIEKSLIKAKEIAENANKSKSLFLANISHELKTPMNSILGYSSLGVEKIDKIDKNKIKNYFEKINQGGKRLLLLLDDLIDVARLENLEIRYDFLEVDIFKILTSSIDDISYKAKEKNIKIKFNNNNDFDSYKIIADKKRIRQVIDNILINAIKFTEKNKKISIYLKKDVDKIILTFKDEGPGIESSEVFKIFESFYQGIRTKNNINNGTGLGLAISKKIILAHHGKIWVHNRNDGVTGSIFNIELPIYF